MRDTSSEYSQGSCESGHCRHFIVHLQPAGNRRGNQGTGRVSDSRPTCFAGQLAIRFHASLSSTRATYSKIDRDLVAVSSWCRNNQPCFSALHRASIMEFE